MIVAYDLREILAALVHRQWSGWMEYLFAQCRPGADGSVRIPPSLVERWRRQIETDYEDLSESEQDSDRREADRFLVALESEWIEGCPTEPGWYFVWNDDWPRGPGIIAQAMQVLETGRDSDGEPIHDFWTGHPLRRVVPGDVVSRHVRWSGPPKPVDGLY